MRYLSEAAIFLIARVATLSTTHAFRPLVPSSHRSTAPPWAPASRIWPCVLPSDTGGVGRRRASHRRPLGAATAFVSEDLAPGATAIDGANDEMNALLNDLRVPPGIKLIDSEEHNFDLDGWARFDMPSDDYYDTTQFPEDFTGYDGSEIWNFIHNRICFHDETISDEYDSDNWKTDFNKAVSGLHSMVSAQIISGISDKIESGEGFEESVEWTDPQAEFKRRLSPSGETPKAIENLYFSYMLILTGAAAARDRLLQDCDSGKIDEASAASLRLVLASPLFDDPSIVVASRKLHDHAVKDENSITALWEARMRTRELMRIMNCVQCNKCRFHGKIAVLGLSTALQVLLGRTGDGGDPSRIHRVELAAMMTTLSKFSNAVSLIKEMQK